MQFERIADKKRIDFITFHLCSRITPGSLILDVGCGNGIISKAVAEKGFKVVAIDVSEKTIEAARRANAHPDVDYKVMGAGVLGSEPGKYDGVICSEVLEHLHQPQQLLHTIYSSLRNDGVLIVTVPNGYGPRELLVTRPVQYLQKKNNIITRALQKTKSLLGYTGTTVQSSADDLSHVRFFTIKHLKKLAGSTGFSIEQVSKANFIEQVFPFSLLTKRSPFLQKIDCRIADMLPAAFTSGFMTVWRKSTIS